MREPVFAQLVLPEILDRIVRWVAANRLGDEDEGPVADWTTFFENLGTDVEALVQSTPEEDVDIVVEDVVRRFTGNHAFADGLMAGFAEEDE